MIPFWLKCTHCSWRRALVPTAPATTKSRAADWCDTVRWAANVKSCPKCGNVESIVAIELDPYGHIAREE